MIAVVGLSHRTAPIDVRERLVLPREAVLELLRSLVANPAVGEALAVSTCNRVEIVVAGVARDNVAEVARIAREAIVARAPGVARYLYEHLGPGGVRHLFRVAASLDSLVLGEPQILGQLKEAFDVAREAGTVGAVLHRVVPRAIRSAKRVRSETSIGAGQVSVPSVAVDLARQIFGDLSQQRVALVGSGEMGETAARLLRQAGASLVVLGRNVDRVNEIAAIIDGQPRTMGDLPATLVDADVVITTTSAPGFVVEPALVQPARRARRGKSLFFIDLAVPRDVDPKVGDLDGVFLYNVDDLSNVVAESIEGRRREADRAEQIVAEEADSYGRWAESEQATPTIVALRERIRSVLSGEVDRSLGGKLRHLGEAEREALVVMIEASLNKMLHPVATRLRRMAADTASRPDLDNAAALLHELFELVPASAEAMAEEEARGPGDDADDSPGSGTVREAS